MNALNWLSVFGIRIKYLINTGWQMTVWAWPKKFVWQKSRPFFCLASSLAVWSNRNRIKFWIEFYTSTIKLDLKKWSGLKLGIHKNIHKTLVYIRYVEQLTEFYFNKLRFRSFYDIHTLTMNPHESRTVIAVLSERFHLKIFSLKLSYFKIDELYSWNVSVW